MKWQSGIGAPSYLNDTEPTTADKLPTFIDEQPEEAQNRKLVYIIIKYKKPKGTSTFT